MTTRSDPRDSAVVRVRACAKINLSLRVLGTRADGYHDLRTIFQSVALHDTLTVTRVDGPFAITSNDPECPRDPSNLVWKAAERLWPLASRRGRPLSGVHVDIHKRIPARAGLGGGSSDAAAALRALRALWRPGLHDDVLREIGASVGADVPFFFEGGTALGVDRGDVVFPMADAPAAWVVIVRPEFGVSTRDAYGWWDAARRARHSVAAAAGAGLISSARRTVNDLQAPVAARHPGILKLVRTLERAGARQAMMSGSGSAVFGLFEGRAAALRVATGLNRGATAAWLTRTLTRRAYARATALIGPKPD